MNETDSPKTPAAPPVWIPPQKPEEPFPLWGPDDFASYQPPEDQHILGCGYIEPGKLTVLLGVGGVGKSRWAVALAVAQIARVPNFCGFPLAQRPRKWLFIGNENNATRWKDDLSKTMAGLTEEQRKRVNAHLAVARLFDEDDPSLNTNEARKRIADTVKAYGAEIVVLDPWAELVEGDENKTEDARTSLTAIRRAVWGQTKERPAVLLIAHARPGGDAAANAGNNFTSGSLIRGNKAVTNSARVVLGLVAGDAEDSSKLVLVAEKMNDAPKFKPIGLTVDPGTMAYTVDEDFQVDAWRKAASGRKQARKVPLDALVQAVKEGVHTTAAFKARFAVDGVSEKAVARALAEAVDADKLVRPKPGFYELPPPKRGKFVINREEGGSDQSHAE